MLADRLREALTREGDTPPLLGDDMPPTDQVVDAAVLIAITDRPDPGVILTQRTDTLRSHPGQVAFPGGRVDPGDLGAIGAALREAEEEIALPPRAVTVVGATDRFRTGSGFCITPVVGIVPPNLPLRPHEAEVAAVFEVPLAFLMNTANHHEASGHWDGRTRRFYEIPWTDRYIWGATAGMIVNLSRRLRWA